MSVSRACDGRGPVAEWSSGVEVLAGARQVQPVTDPGDMTVGVIGGAGRLCPGGVPEQVAAGLAAVFSAVT